MKRRDPRSGSVPGNGSRPGVATLWALVVMAVLTTLIVAITRQTLGVRRSLEQRRNKVQATWLARAGQEMAIARLLNDPADEKEQTVEVAPRSQVRIQVRKEGEKPEQYQVTVEVRHPTDDPRESRRSLTRHYRRIVEKDQVRLEVIPAPAKK